MFAVQEPETPDPVSPTDGATLYLSVPADYTLSSIDVIPSSCFRRSRVAVVLLFFLSLYPSTSLSQLWAGICRGAAEMCGRSLCSKSS